MIWRGQICKSLVFAAAAEVSDSFLLSIKKVI